MKRDDAVVIVLLLSLLFWGVAVLITWERTDYFATRKGYKEACIDFYQGKLKMDLMENPDGTKEWKWIGK